ncbi:MAG TPA: aminotransferase class IV [Polyangiales bacterium]|nr:aminotransferase class IV [Polyangiales bacterium]
MKAEHVEPMRGQVCIDGVLHDAASAQVSVFDRGFLYGDSVFEVLRTYGGKPFCEREHLERLAQSCRRLLIPITTGPDDWSREIARTVAASGMPECNVRVMVTRGVGALGLDLSKAQNPSTLVFALPLELPPERFYRDGIRVGLVHVGRATDGTSAVGAKTSNYLASVLALHEVKQRGCDEAIVIGAHGEVVEGATSNVFAVVRGELFTPPIAAGILAGITRHTVIAVATQLGIPVHETQMHPEDLYRADEVFITSTIRELVPVTRVDDVVIAAGTPGPMALQLLSGYRALARG